MFPAQYMRLTLEQRDPLTLTFVLTNTAQDCKCLSSSWDVLSTFCSLADLEE